MKSLTILIVICAFGSISALTLITAQLVEEIIEIVEGILDEIEQFAQLYALPKDIVDVLKITLLEIRSELDCLTERSEQKLPTLLLMSASASAQSLKDNVDSMVRNNENSNANEEFGNVQAKADELMSIVSGPETCSGDF